MNIFSYTDQVQIASFVLESVGLILIIIETFFSDFADAIERYIDSTAENLKQYDINNPIHFDNIARKLMLLGFLIPIVVSGIIIFIYKVFRKYYYGEYYESVFVGSNYEEEHMLMDNLTDYISLPLSDIILNIIEYLMFILMLIASMMIGFLFIYPLGLVIIKIIFSSMKMLSYIIDRLNKLTDNRALGALGLILAIIGIISELYQVIPILMI